MVSFVRSVASGLTAIFPVTFAYLDRSHVKVSLNGALTTAFTWLDAGNIQLNAGAPTAGTLVERRRETPVTAITTFVSGNLDTTDLNVASLQPLFLAEEANDDAADLLARAWTTAGFGAAGTILKGTQGQHAVYDASGNLQGVSSNPGTGDMLRTAYDTLGRGDDVYDRTHHRGEDGGTPYATLAAFAALPSVPADIKYAFVSGHTTQGDGGHHWRYRLPAPVAAQVWHTVLADGSRWDIADNELDTRMFGALAAVTDNAVQLQKAIDCASFNLKKLHARGGIIRASGGLFFSSNLVIEWDAATWWKQTAYSATGAFVSNVWPAVDYLKRQVSNIVLIRPQIDLSAISYVGNTTDSENCLGFARGASKIWINGGTLKGAKPNFNITMGGFGGKGINLDGGVSDVMIIGTRMEGCYQGLTIRGRSGNFAFVPPYASDGPESAVRVSVAECHFEDCMVAICINGSDTTKDPDRDPSVYNARINGITYHNCGFCPDFPQLGGTTNTYKSGIFMLGEATNVQISNVFGYNDTDYIAQKGGWPVTGNVIGVGLSGAIGALVYGWGSNVRITNWTHIGDVVNMWKMARAYAIGDDAGPTTRPICTLFVMDHITVQGVVSRAIAQSDYAASQVISAANWTGRVTNLRLHSYSGIMDANCAIASGLYVQAFNSALREVKGQADWILANNNVIGTRQVTGPGNFQEYTDMSFAANGQQSIQLPDVDGFLLISCATATSGAPVQALVRYRTAGSGGSAILEYWPANATALANFALAVNNTPQTAASTLTVTLSDTGLLSVDNQRGNIGLLSITKLV